MTIRINDIDLGNTESMVKTILPLVQKGERVLFLTHAGSGENVMARIRVKISRVRKRMKRQGKQMRRFNLHASIYPHTEGGIRFDAVVVWYSRSEHHVYTEMLEDLLS